MIDFAAAAFASILAAAVQAPSETAPAVQTAQAPGAVSGRFEVRIDGRRTSCTGVYLIPQSEGVDMEIERVFGGLERGRRYVGGAELRSRSSDTGTESAGGVPGLRSTDCPGWPQPTFSFADVPPGDYYVTAYFSPPRSLGDPASGFPARGLEVMKRIRVDAGRTAAVRFRN